MGFPGGASSKEPACPSGDKRDVGLIPGSGRSLEEGNGNPLQYSCLENSTVRGAWWATVHGVKESDTTEQLTHAREYRTSLDQHGVFYTLYIFSRY